jgi:hypothetical protein
MPIQESNILSLPPMKLTTLLPLLVLGVVPATASVIFIDNFSVNQTVFSPNQSGVVGSGLFGGARSLEVIADDTFDYGRVNAGALTLALAPADVGFALLTYDGDTNGTLNQAGIAPTDLTDGGQNIFIGLSVRSDLVAPITMTFYSGNGNSSSYTINAPGLGFATAYTEFLIPMTQFISMSGTGANFTSITAATLLIDGTNPGVDVQVRNYAAMPTPEPSTFGLIGAGLVGLAAFRRRKA